jgi:hypothetical protein
MAAFRCPSCGHSQAVDEKFVGRNATCPKCKASATVVAESLAPTTPSSDSGGPVVHRKVGGPMGIDADLRNKESKLRREWIIVDDSRLPVGFHVAQTQGINTGKKYNGHSFDWLFTNRSVVFVRHESVSAFEIRHLTFDIWGDHVRTLTGSEIADHTLLDPGSTRDEFDFRDSPGSIEVDHQWNLYTENEAWAFYASITYMARVRTAAGKVIEAETDAIIREARRFTEQFSAEQLEPTTKKP